VKVTIQGLDGVQIDHTFWLDTPARAKFVMDSFDCSGPVLACLRATAVFKYERTQKMLKLRLTLLFLRFRAWLCEVGLVPVLDLWLFFLMLAIVIVCALVGFAMFLVFFS
jgi:hypothetical protein